MNVVWTYKSKSTGIELSLDVENSLRRRSKSNMKSLQLTCISTTKTSKKPPTLQVSFHRESSTVYIVL